MITKADRERLRELAGNATPGPWNATPHSWAPHQYDIDGPADDKGTEVACEAFGDDNAAFIAANNPAATLSLLDALD